MVEESAFNEVLGEEGNRLGGGRKREAAAKEMMKGKVGREQESEKGSLFAVESEGRSKELRGEHFHKGEEVLFGRETEIVYRE
ncbi:hypothetical protein Ddc_17027 [Ditylenchus destructor]|nr:hypothetical protein Ddc_17027 [Ditylenchus destructor]